MLRAETGKEGANGATLTPREQIEGLTGERDALQTQNAQLWRLVDKQRTMIQGLQKDLDRYVAEASTRQVTKVDASTSTSDAPDVQPLQTKRRSVKPSPKSQDLSKLLEAGAPTKSPLRLSIGKAPRSDEAESEGRAVLSRTQSYSRLDAIPSDDKIDRTAIPRRERLRSVISTPGTPREGSKDLTAVASQIASQIAAAHLSPADPSPDKCPQSPESNYSDSNAAIDNYFGPTFRHTPVLEPSAEFPEPVVERRRSSTTDSFLRAFRDVGPIIYDKQQLGAITAAHLPELSARLVQALLPSYAHLPTVMILGVYFSDGSLVHQVKKQYSSIHKLATRFELNVPPSSDFRQTDPLDTSARKRRIDEFLGDVLSRSEHADDVAQFLSTNDLEVPAIFYPGTVEERPPRAETKEGYLSKRGKNLGAWKHRYFVLEGQELRMYDSDGSTVQDVFALAGAQVGRQSAERYRGEAGMEFDYAFIVIVRGVKHVLSAASEEDRAAWMASLIEAADLDDTFAVSYSSVAARPQRQSLLSEPEEKVISAPMNGAVINNAFQWGANPVSILPLSPSARSVTSASSTLPPSLSSQTLTEPKKKEKKKPFWVKKKHESPKIEVVRPVEARVGGSQLFGMNLAEAVQRTALPESPFIPAILYRCITFLEAHHMEQEEGIYRLSGSATAIKQLRELFNAELDVDLLEGEHDMHAVAGLLKLYLRELPAPILGRDVQSDFMELMEMPSGAAKTTTLRTIIHSLPPDTTALLTTLCSHLNNVVRHSDVNKMTMRNVGIVFSPTLNIPANVIETFIEQATELFAEHEGVRSPLAPVFASEVSGRQSPMSMLTALSGPPSASQPTSAATSHNPFAHLPIHQLAQNDNPTFSIADHALDAEQSYGLFSRGFQDGPS